MSKRTYGHVLVLLSRGLVCPAANYYNYYDYRPEAADKFTNPVQTKKKTMRNKLRSWCVSIYVCREVQLNYFGEMFSL